MPARAEQIPHIGDERAAAGPTRTISLRELNRATLARQLLLERAEGLGVPAVLEHLVGLQAQTANTWYTGFWSRLADFDPLEASRLLERRRIVRVALMRSTIHLVTAEDALRLRPLLQPAVEGPMKAGYWRRELGKLHADEVAAAGRALLDETPLTNTELGERLAKRWPEPKPGDIAMGVRVWVPLVQVPPRGLWGRSGASRHAPLESWVGRPLEPGMTADELVQRYLAAFGPATPADAQAWSGLTRLREVFERLRPRLLVLRDEDGRELFDVPDAPRPPGDTPAPPRFLYDYDNLQLSHDDRTRFASKDLRSRLLKEIGGYSYGSLLVDGFVAGLWRIERDRGTAALVVRLVQKLTSAEREAVSEEGERLLQFWTRDSERHELRMRAEAG